MASSPAAPAFHWDQFMIGENWPVERRCRPLTPQIAMAERRIQVPQEVVTLASPQP